MGDIVHLELQLAQVILEIDETIFTKIRIRQAGFDIDRNQLLAQGRQEDALDFPVGPILDAPGLRRREQRWA